MKNFILALLGVLSIGSAQAHLHPQPGKFGVIAEYLYFMPSFDDTYFVIDSAPGTTSPAGERLNNDFDYRSGYRIGAAYGFCTCQRTLEVTYSHLNGSHNRTVAGTDLFATVGTPQVITQLQGYEGTATARYSAQYNRVDGLFTQSIFDCCGTNVHFLFGLEWASLQLNENNIYTSDTSLGEIEQKSRAWGVGPEIGFEVDYAFFACNQGCLPGTVSLIVKSTASLLSASSWTSIDATATTRVPQNSKDESTWRVIPALHARIGLGFDTNVCGLGSSFEIGYEYSSYIRGYGRVVYPDDVGVGFSITNYNNYDLQGLYVSGSVSF
jgi:hypothetical protein